MAVCAETPSTCRGLPSPWVLTWQKQETLVSLPFLQGPQSQHGCYILMTSSKSSYFTKAPTSSYHHSSTYDFGVDTDIPSIPGIALGTRDTAGNRGDESVVPCWELKSDKQVDHKQDK